MQETVNTLSLETEKLRSEMIGLNRLADNFGQTITRSFASAIIQGRKLSDVLKSLALSLAGQALSSALKPLGNLAGSLLGSATPFASGGIVNSPTLFPLRGGTGLMGEAGAEAIMPLARGGDGKLGVRMSGGQAANVTVNISTPDAASFRQSQSQIASVITRAVSRGQRNL
jgi:phage-related minor tail protein